MSITLSKGAETLTIDTPRWGYECAVHCLIYQRRLANGTYAFRDDGSSYDWRTCRATWLAPKATIESMAQWFRYYTSARGETFNLELGGIATGFFPFGPDKGDLGTFEVRVIDVQQDGWLISPLGYAEITVEMVMVSAPAYVLPTEYAEGTLEIGPVSGLRWPEGGYKPQATLGLRTDVSRSGGPYTTDFTDDTDSWESEWVQRCNQGKAAALMSYLCGAGRAAEVTIRAPARHYPFGVEQHAVSDEAGLFTARLTLGEESGTQIVMRHIEHEHWEIPLRWWMQGTQTYYGIDVDADTGMTVEATSGYAYA